MNKIKYIIGKEKWEKKNRIKIKILKSKENEKTFTKLKDSNLYK